MKYDVVVAGAGPSGICAAIAAARMGQNVLLIDKNGYPGGMNTAAMVCPLMAFHSGEKQVIKGIAQEIIDRLKAKSGTLGHIPDPLGVTSSITPIEPDILRLVYFEMLAELSNITLLFHSFIANVEKKDKVLKSITVVNKSGQNTYYGSTFIDATGDGDVAALAKIGFDLGRPNDSLSQPMTIMFKVGGINFQEIIKYIRENPEQFITSENYNLEEYLAVSGFFDIVCEAKKNGDFDIPRDRVLFFQGVYPGELFINTSRVLKLSGTSGKDLTTAEIEAHRQVDILLKFFRKYLPGFENGRLISIADVTGVRESRRIHGKYTLTIEDIYKERVFDTSVAICAFPIDIHDPSGNDLQWVRGKKDFCYDIPFEVMQPKKIDNLLVTGRCISATHEALASARISPTAMALGQAAGVAAALAVRQGKSFSELSIHEIQDELRSQNAIPTKADI